MNGANRPDGGWPSLGARVVGAAMEGVSAAAAGLVGVALLWARQEQLVWQPPRVRARDLAPPAGAVRLDYAAADGQPLFAWVVEPWAGPDAARTGHARAGAPRTLLAFHGNAELAAWTVPWAREVARRTGWRVVLPEYRGYAGLPGSPNYPCSRRDAWAAWTAARDRLGITDVALFGHSLGTAVAAELAADLTERAPTEGTPPARLGALVLQAPFSSARAMARVVSGAALERWWARIARVHFDTAAVVAALDAPVWVAHGALDLVIPARMGQVVHAAARRPGELLRVPLAGHNDVPAAGGEGYWRWLERALAAAGEPPAAGTRAGGP